MSDTSKKTPLKSVSKSPVQRSRGFLSNPGSAAPAKDDTGQAKPRGLSRGSRSHQPSADLTKPKPLDLAVKPRSYGGKKK